MYRIFLVEDDGALASAIEKTLADYGSEVRRAVDFRSVAVTTPPLSASSRCPCSRSLLPAMPTPTTARLFTTQVR